MKRNTKSSDELGQQLRRDARAIGTEVSPALRRRIDAALAAATRQPAAPRRHVQARRFHWASGLVGVAAAAALIAVLNRPPAEPQAPPSATPAYTAELPNPVALKLRHAELTEPLEEELTHLRADVDKVRKAVERDLGVTF